MSASLFSIISILNKERLRVEDSGPSKKAIVGLVAVVLLVIAATVVVVSMSDSEQQAVNTSDTVGAPSSSSASSSGANTSEAEPGGMYDDGTYVATGTYFTPGGQESIGVTITVADGAVAEAVVKQNARGGEAKDYQAAFVANYKPLVEGKKLDEIKLSRVAGSSLTPVGFNLALEDIRSQAKS